MQCPVLVIVGAEDGLTPPGESEKMAKTAKGAKLVKVPGAGHLANIENPEPFTRALSDFMDGLPA
jgi:pimeloyl-ACP methyl ester carboxylesterase